MNAPFTIPLECFWAWLVNHADCILRAGTLDTVIHDDENFHWRFGTDDKGFFTVQVLRGKRLMAELVVEPDRVTYVEAVAVENQEEHHFELISETERDRYAAYFFVLAHGYEEAGDSPGGRVH